MSNTSRVLTALLLVAGSSGCAAPAAGEDLCRSPQFREAFLEGQQGVIIDYTDPSPKLISLGDRAIPCLTRIAEQGGVVFDIEGCLGGPDGCSGWALGAIRMIDTPDARAYLLGYTETVLDDPEKLATAIRMLGSLQDPTARPRLQGLLKHPSHDVRAQSVVSLGAIGDQRDFDVMLETSLELSDEAFFKVIHGFRLLGDARALELLMPRVKEISDETMRFASERALDSWKAAHADHKRLLTTLRSGTEWDLIEALRQIKSPVSPEARAAVLELLAHDDPLTRAESVIAVGKMHVALDFDRMLTVTLALPEPYVARASRGLVLLNDPRAISPLEKYAATMTNSQRQRELRGYIEQIRRSSDGSNVPATNAKKP